VTYSKSSMIADAVRDQLQHTAISFVVTADSYRGVKARKLSARIRIDENIFCGSAHVPLSVCRNSGNRLAPSPGNTGQTNLTPVGG